MQVEALMELIRDEEAFKKAFRKTDPAVTRELNSEGEVVDVAGEKNEVYKLIAGQFRPGRVPFVHQVVLPDGSQIRVKFTNTIKKIYNSKNVELTGKESYLSYYEVIVAPVGQKAYSWTSDVNQIVWGASPSKAREKHAICIKALVAEARGLKIDLEEPTSWNTIYSENY